MSEEEIQEWGTAFEEMLRNPVPWIKGAASHGDEHHACILAIAAKNWVEAERTAKVAKLQEWRRDNDISDLDSLIRWLFEELLAPWTDHIDEWDTLEKRISRLEQRLDTLVADVGWLMSKTPRREVQDCTTTYNGVPPV